MIKTLQKRAFTLIELLVVIAIIGILASLIIVSLSGARSKATDTQRKNNARNLDTALSQYFTDNNNTYPGSNSAGAAVSTDLVTACTSGASAVLNNTSGNTSTSATLFGSSGYIVSTGVCNDPASSQLFHHYNAVSGTSGAGAQTALGPSAARYMIAWQLAAQSEAAVTTGNGVYVTTGATGIVTAGSGMASTIGALTAGTKAFVTYGPQ